MTLAKTCRMICTCSFDNWRMSYPGVMFNDRCFFIIRRFAKDAFEAAIDCYRTWHQSGHDCILFAGADGGYILCFDFDSICEYGVQVAIVPEAGDTYSPCYDFGYIYGRYSVSTSGASLATAVAA